MLSYTRTFVSFIHSPKSLEGQIRKVEEKERRRTTRGSQISISESHSTGLLETVQTTHKPVQNVAKGTKQ